MFAKAGPSAWTAFPPRWRGWLETGLQNPAQAPLLGTSLTQMPSSVSCLSPHLSTPSTVIATALPCPSPTDHHPPEGRAAPRRPGCENTGLRDQSPRGKQGRTYDSKGKLSTERGLTHSENDLNEVLVESSESSSPHNVGHTQAAWA